ncbi:MAG: DEAD/DEAH box helicase, partial [Anaerolineales bacterium]|nr:DEAD/DEAH box helicase [Anaerolineales bacterium]
MSISGLLQAFDDLPAFQEFLTALDGSEPVPPLELPMSARPAILAKLLAARRVPTVLLTGRVDAVGNWMQALEMWLPSDISAMRLPEPTPLPYDRGPWSERARNGRLQVFTQLMAGQHPQIPAVDSPPFIVTSARAFLQKTLPKRRFISATRVLRVGQLIDLEKLARTWLGAGYEWVSVVEEAGQFSRRGGILDIFPIAAAYPVRIELFGDEIETMRFFNPATQRSLLVDGSSSIDRVVVPPAREALPEVARAYALTLSDTIAANRPDNLPSWQDDLPHMSEGNAFPNLEYYLPLLYPQPGSLLDYLPSNVQIVVDDWPALETAVRELHEHADQIANEQPSLPPNYPSPIFEWEMVATDLNWWQPVVLGSGEAGDRSEERPFLALADAFDPGPRYGGQVRPLMTQLKTALSDNERLVIVSRQSARLADLWREETKTTSASTLVNITPLHHSQSNQRLHTSSPLHELNELPENGTLTFVNAGLAEGFTLVRRDDNHTLLDLLTDAEIFGWNRPAPRRWRPQRPAAPEAQFADIKAGDYVVHLEYGIGLFQGLVSRNIGGMDREYLLLKYANGDVLYVPAHHADRLGKWVGADDRPPKMHRLGEKSWTAAKAKAQKAADELAGELLELYAARETIDGHAFTPDTEWQIELEAGFPYRETEDQLRVIAEVKADMERAQPMDRLICGDVGYGKTEVALRAAFKAVMDSKQVAILVPTTVLAQQHFNTFRERLNAFPVTVQMLSRFRTQAQQQRIVRGLKNGRVDIIIG